MSNLDDRWLWFIDDAPLQALLKAEGELGTMRMRAASSPGLVRAMAAHMEGRTTEAAAELRTAIDNGERQPEAFLFLGQIHFEARQYEEAEGVYQSLLAIDPDHATAAFNAGVCQEKLSRWGEAADYFRRSVKLDPQRRDAWLGLGLCCLHQRRADEALNGFDRYLEGEPDNEPAQFGRAVALQMLRRFEEAEAIYERFRGGGEPSAELLTNLLASAVARKDAAALSQIAGELARLRPGIRQAAEAQAYSAFLSGEWEDAASHLAQLSNGDPLPEDWAYAHCYVLWRCAKNRTPEHLDGLQEALKEIDSLLRNRTNHPAALLLRGVLMEDLGRVEEAMSCYRKAAAQSPDSDAASWNLARLAASAGKSDVCKQAAKTLIERNRHSAEGWFANGLAATIEKRNADAVRAFTEALRLRKEWPEAEWNLGLSQLEAGDTESAERSLANGHEALAGQIAVEPLARALFANGRSDRALAVLETAGQANNAPELLYNIAVSFHEGGKLEQAEQLYRRVIDSGAPFADAHINLGHVLLAGGRPDAAEECWAAALAMEAA